MTTDIREEVMKAAQGCLSACPVVILGSGSSATVGVRGMGPLQEYLTEHVRPSSDTDRDNWTSFIKALSESNDLEVALQKVSLSPGLLRQVVHFTRQMILSDDAKVFWRIVEGELSLPLSRLYTHLFASTHRVVSVVTPNYDRLAEFAAEAAGYMVRTGFSNGYLRTFQGADGSSKKPSAERTVEVWKVHGSVDWFLNTDAMPIALPCDKEPPESFDPLLVTPGIAKYEMTHREPFRTIMASADAALANAPAFLCNGFGFNDHHIEPKLLQRVRQQGVPIVILARTLRDTAKAFVQKSGARKYLAMEKAATGTRAYLPGHPDGIDLDGVNWWSLDEFLDSTIESK